MTRNAVGLVVVDALGCHVYAPAHVHLYVVDKRLPVGVIMPRVPAGIGVEGLAATAGVTDMLKFEKGKS